VKTERGVVVGNVFDKYGSKNPLARRLVDGFLASFDRCVGLSGASTATEVGCGEGELSFRLARCGLSTRAFDISRELIAEARSRAREENLAVEFANDDVYTFEPRDFAAELVVCCEVLEHLSAPETALRRLAQAARTHVLLSVPQEPMWRLLNLARLRYVPALGNTPGHVQHWSRRRFLDLVESYFDPVCVESPLPWTMVLARVRVDISPATPA
jgi:SAM-dependent methyltransferase